MPCGSCGKSGRKSIVKSAKNKPKKPIIMKVKGNKVTIKKQQNGM